MVIPKEALENARKMLEEAARPLIFHDDDPDGMCAGIIAYQFAGDGKIITVKNSPVLKAEYLRKVDEFSPDLIVVLDKPMVEEEFFEGTQIPVLWIDHHAPQTEQVKLFGNVTYLNPRIWDDEENTPTSSLLYKITGINLWLATVGTVADWHIPVFIDEFADKYPGIIPDEYEKVEDLYLDTPIGELIAALHFNLKGSVSDTRKSVLTLSRIESPEEILKQTSSRGRFIWRKYRKLYEPYQGLVQQARDWVKDNPGDVLLFVYNLDNQSFTAELSNELLIRYPERLIVVARHHDGKYKCSLRSKEIPIPDRLNAALEGLDGYGGGHTNACGCVIAEDDWETFTKRFFRV